MSRIATLLLCLVAIAASTAQVPDFVNVEANHISLNGADWSALRKSLRQPDTWPGGKWQAVQIGDSHIQPDMMTAPMRRRMQQRWGNGGRGLVAALNLARTNEPRDYLLKSSQPVAARSRLLSRSWTTNIGLTGVAVRWDTAFTELSIKAKNPDDAFSSVVLLHDSRGGYETASAGGDVLFGKELSAWATRFDLPALTDTITMGVPCTGDFYGAILTNKNRGVMVHSIGNNGATCASYLKIDRLAEQMRVLEPRLIIISLGTNEAFGSLAGVEDNLHQLVTSLKQAMPQAQFLLTTPMECHKRVTRQVAQQVRVPGRKRRKARTKTVYKTVTSHAVNPNVAHVRDIITGYGRRHGIAVWDLYAVSGGAGAAERWLSAGLMNPNDHLHQLEAGYDLQGRLLADALIEVLTAKQ